MINISFGRALTTAETQLLSAKLKEAKKEAGIEHIAMNLPIAAVPAEPDKNTGIGTFVGSTALMEKIAPLTGIDTKLMLPIGHISKTFNYSPYSQPAFSLYTGYIDPFLLTTPEFNLLNPEKDKNILDAVRFRPSNEKQDYRTQYENINNIEAVLDRAYDNFSENIADYSSLKKEFETFKQKHNYWLKPYAALEWNSPKEPERYMFKQFIAEKQYQKMRKADKEMGINTIVDIPIGNDRVWDAKVIEDNTGEKIPFLEDINLACRDRNNIVDWGMPVPDPRKEPVQDFIYRKIKYQGENGEGVRLDAFDHLMYCQVTDQQNSNIRFTNVYEDNYTAIVDEIMRGIKDSGADMEFSFAENKPLFGEDFSTKQIQDVEKYMKQNNLTTPSILSEKRYYGTDSWLAYRFGHDSGNIHHHANIDYSSQPKPKIIKDNFYKLLNGKDAKKAHIMFTDVFGCEDLYNFDPNGKEPWRFRLPENWEALYHSQLQELDKHGNPKHCIGFNAPEIFAEVLEKKSGVSKELIESLKKFAAILKKPGVTTQKEADKIYGKEFLEISA